MYNRAILVVVVVATIAGVLFLLNNSRKTTPSGSTNTTTPSGTSPISGQTSQETTITLTSSGFSPSTLPIKAGTRVFWVNKSGATATVNSAVHPTHKAYPPLNLGQFNNDTSLQLVFNKKGLYRYHNHFNPTQTGTVTVK